METEYIDSLYCSVSLIEKEYDSSNQLTKVICREGNASGLIKYTQENIYNYDGQRISKTNNGVVSYRYDDYGTWNLYTYCGGSPINYVDPSGHKLTPKQKAAKKIIKKNKKSIKGAAFLYGVDPGIVGGVIFAEQVLNVDWKDKYPPIASSPGILGTLCNNGKTKAHNNPKSNEFGRYVKKYYKKVSSWLYAKTKMI